MEIKQYEIILVNLDPTVGGEMTKTRPCAVISPDEMNKYLQTIVISPITSTSKSYPTRVEIKHSKTKGWVVLDQIRTIDKVRVIKTLDNLKTWEIEKIKAVIMETYVE
jgi:mRNA interferase MazF